MATLTLLEQPRLRKKFAIDTVHLVLLNGTKLHERINVVSKIH